MLRHPVFDFDKLFEHSLHWDIFFGIAAEFLCELFHLLVNIPGFVDMAMVEDVFILIVVCFSLI